MFARRPRLDREPAQAWPENLPSLPEADGSETAAGGSITSGRRGRSEAPPFRPHRPQAGTVLRSSISSIDNAARLKTATQILWYGRNNIGKANAEQEIISSLDTSIAYITAPARYIVLGVLLASAETKGTKNYNEVTAINDKLAAKYGSSFVEMTPPTDSEMAAISYTPSADDLTDLKNLNFPRGMRADIATDDIHLNDKGYLIIANRVVQKIKALEY